MARCDAAIGKLASDLKTANDQLRNLGGAQTDEFHKVVERMQTIDNKVRKRYKGGRRGRERRTSERRSDGRVGGGEITSLNITSC